MNKLNTATLRKLSRFSGLIPNNKANLDEIQLAVLYEHNQFVMHTMDYGLVNSTVCLIQQTVIKLFMSDHKPFSDWIKYCLTAPYIQLAGIEKT